MIRKVFSNNTENRDEKASEPGRVSVVGAGPGDPELLTLKAVRVLQEADIIFYDRLITLEILTHACPDIQKISVGKQYGKPSTSQKEINRLMVIEALQGKSVVRLKGGDPFIFGRGGEECLALSRHGIPFEVVPGISSISAVPAYAGIPLTMRNLATGFTVISGHLHPASSSYDWSVLSKIPTLVILMGLNNIDGIVRQLTSHGKSADTPAALISRGTTQMQNVVTGVLSDISSNARGIASPAIIIIGQVAAYHESLNWFEPEIMTDDLAKAPKSLHTSLTFNKTAASL